MAVKSIIDLEINDGAFQRFAALFAKYQQQLKATPDAWKKVADETDAALDKTVTGVEEVSDATDKVAKGAAATSVSFRQTYIMVQQGAQQLDRVGRSQVVAARAVGTQARAWHDMARNARSFAGHIGDATRSLLRWSALTGIISGLLGAGGLFGIERLAGSAANQRRGALGLGASPGEVNAFRLNYGRVVDTDQFLGGVNQSMHDLSKRSSLYGAGLSERDLAGKDTAGVAAELLPALKKIADQTQESQLAQVLQSRKLDQFISLEDFQRLKHTSAAELDQYGSAYRRDSKSLNVADPTLKAWQDFKVQLERAGTQIENTFIKGLVPLAGPLGHLSDEFTHLVEVLLKNPLIEKWINGLSHGLEQFASYVGTPEFEQKVQNFVKGVGDFATAVGEAFTSISTWLTWWKGKSAGDILNNGPGGNGPLTDDNPRAPGSPAFNRQRALERGEVEQPAASEGRKPWDWSGIFNRGDGGINMTPDLQSYETDGGLPKGLLKNIEYQESGGRDLTSKAGAQGYFQFMPGTARQYGVDVHDEASSARGAARYLADLKAQFGSTEKAVAAYNWGPGNLEKDIREHGDRWREYLPKETSDYLASIGGRLAQQQRQQTQGPSRAPAQVQINVHNNTGGSAVVAASQLAV